MLNNKSAENHMPPLIQMYWEKHMLAINQVHYVQVAKYWSKFFIFLYTIYNVNLFLYDKTLGSAKHTLFVLFRFLCKNKITASTTILLQFL